MYVVSYRSGTQTSSAIACGSQTVLDLAILAIAALLVQARIIRRWCWWWGRRRRQCWLRAVGATPTGRTTAAVAPCPRLAERDHGLKLGTMVGKSRAALLPEGQEDAGAARVAASRDPAVADPVVGATTLAIHLGCVLRHVCEVAGAGAGASKQQPVAACRRRARWQDSAGAAVLAGSCAAQRWPAALLARLQVDTGPIV
eukprot:COSAG01_NODE_2490_length_7582_cov_5.100561_3_plen_200_part_00